MKKMTKMIAAGIMLVAGFLAATAQAATPDYLSFTAVGGDVTIGMTPYGSPSVPALETSADPTAATWNTFTAGTTTIALADGETVYFRRSNTTKGTTFNASASGWTFTMTGTGLVDAGGVITSLIRKDCLTGGLGKYAYQNLFQGCTLLRTAPSFPATTLADYCYKNLFDGCSNLERVTVGFTSWNATNYTLNWLNGVAPAGFLFASQKLSRAVTSSVNTLPSGWYAVPTPPQSWSVGADGTEVYAFTNSPSHLVLAGRGKVNALASEIPADVLNTIKVLTIYESVTNAVEGAFEGLGTASDPVAVVIPAEWKGEKPTAGGGEWYGGFVKAPDYLSFTAVGGAVTIGMKAFGSPAALTLETTSDPLAGPWNAFTAGTTAIALNDGETVYFRRASATAPATLNGSASGWTFTATGTGLVDAGGVITSLIDKSCERRSVAVYSYYKLFQNCALLRTAPALPATGIDECSYYCMFQDCTGLTDAPALPATSLPRAQSYRSMFSGCTSLTNIPALPAKSVMNGGYYDMFKGCTSLKKAPELLAESLGQNACNSMFSGCRALTTVPALSIKNPGSQGCDSMFKDCIALTNAPALPATTLAGSCYSSMFSGCTALTEMPDLSHITSLASSCCAGMFNNCTSLTHVVVPPPTELAASCYKSMF